MKIVTLFTSATFVLAACTANPGAAINNTSLPIAGTWQLISGTTIEKGDTSITWYNKNLSFIKIINHTHFAFLKHDLTKGKVQPQPHLDVVEADIRLQTVCIPNIWSIAVIAGGKAMILLLPLPYSMIHSFNAALKKWKPPVLTG